MSEARSRPAVLLLGNPNAGKTTLFNALSGHRARVSNYPGVTVERRAARIRIEGREVELVDLPGTYSLSARSPEEAIAAHELFHARRSDVLVLVADATTLARGLYLVLQALETPLPAVLALTMVDEAAEAGIEIDREALGAALGVPVVDLCIPEGRGLDELRAEVGRALDAAGREPLLTEVPSLVRERLEGIERIVHETGVVPPSSARAYAGWALLSVGDDELRDVPPSIRDAVRLDADDASAIDRAFIAARYAFIDELVGRVTARPESEAISRSEKIDRILTHPVSGLLIFAAVMMAIFETLFTVAEPLIEGIEDFFDWLKEAVVGVMPEGLLRDLIVEGLISGVGNVLVFVPQIALLFFLVTLLEDSGYLARVAFLIDRLMKGVGLHGKAFVPLLSGFACAIPAVMATRTIEKRRDRLITMLAVPFMSCSARLPVYILVIGVVFASDERVFGIFSQSSLALFGIYTFSVAATLFAAFLLRKTVLRGPAPSFMIELPPYRLPMLGTTFRTAFDKIMGFIKEAGTIILAFTIIFWALLSFPKDEHRAESYENQREAAAATLSGDELEEAIAEIDNAERMQAIEESYVGRVAVAIEPAIEPLGFDYRLGIGLIGAFTAREVFVSTMGLVFSIGDEVDEEDSSLRTLLSEAERPDGSPLMTPLVGISLMVFFVLASQCMSTLAVIRRESGGMKWAAFSFFYMTTLAFIGSFLVMRIGTLLGFA